MEFAMVVILIGVLTLLGGRPSNTALDVEDSPAGASVETGAPVCGSGARHERDLTLPYSDQVQARREAACQPDPADD